MAGWTCTGQGHGVTRFAGDTVEYIQVAEGHTASTWANHLRAVLLALFGSR